MRKSNRLISTRELHAKKLTWRGLAIILIFLGGHPTTCFASHILYDASKNNIITNPKERKKNSWMHTHTHKMIEPQLSWGLGQERSSNQNGEKFLWWISKVLVWKVWILLSVVLSIKMHFDIFWRPVNILWISIEIPFLKQALYKNISSLLNSKWEWRRDQHFLLIVKSFPLSIDQRR